MKTNKILIFALGLALIVVAGCTPQDTGLNNNTDRLSTQTRLNNNWDDNGMNNGMDNTMNDLNNGMNGTTGMNGNDNLNNGMVRNNNNRLTTSLGNMNTQASSLARKIGALPEVDSASVVLTDDTCLVGVDLKGNNNNNETISTALRQKIEKMVKDTNNVDVENVSITADPDLTTRIKNISKGMTNTVGNDMNDFTNDIEKLIRDIVPGGRGSDLNR